MSDKPQLKPVNGHPGYFGCSACGVAFKPNPNDQGEMTQLFIEHLRICSGKKKPREDVNQAAARIVREATEGR
ncbi:MAG: hypothetical protein ACLPN1_11850 [Dissulfurispiraceae bacterium]|jgi:hypothetical protein